MPDELEDTDNGQALINTFDDVLDIHAVAFQTVHDSKQETTEAKAVMDEKHVGLQNVMYEKRHLIEEILKCKSFR